MLYAKFYLETSFWMLLYTIDEQFANIYHELPCSYCGNNMYWGNYPRKSRGLPSVATEIFFFRFSCCCSRCRKRRTPPSVLFLGRRVYSCIFIMMFFYPYADNEHKRLCDSVSSGMVSRTPIRWGKWWLNTIPVSFIWKELCGTLVANTNNEFLPHFIFNQFINQHGNSEKAVEILHKFIAPISEPKNYPPSRSD